MSDGSVTPAASAACARLLEDAEQLSARLTLAVRRELPGYAHLPEHEHGRNVHDSLLMLLQALSQGAGPTAAQLRTIESGTHRRISQGLPVHEVLAAFQIVLQATWEELRATAADDRAIVSLTAPLWEWERRMSTTVAAIYAEAASASGGEDVIRRQRFFELLDEGVTGDGRADTLARELDYRAAGEFTALVSSADAWTRGLLEPLQRELKRHGGLAHGGLHARLMIVIVQSADIEQTAAAIVALGGPTVRVGVGMRREGLGGAAKSIRDAERALARCTTDAPVVAFADVWLSATVAAAGDGLTPLFDVPRRVAREHPDLAAAVLAFAHGGFSAVAAGERLHVHPNTVRYRLNRWRELTGLEPREFDDLVRSVSALQS